MGGPTAQPTSHDITAQLEEHRARLTAFCHRRVGSHDAEDAVQETFVRALSAVGQFEGRGTLEGWLYSIAANVCVDMLERRQRRARPMAFGPADDSPTASASGVVAEVLWIERPGGRVDPSTDPVEVTASREAVERALAGGPLPTVDAARCADSPRSTALEGLGSRRTPPNQRGFRQQRTAAR